MNYTTLGRTGLKVSRLCLGTMNFGPHTSPEESFAIMDRARETGVNFFDTANRYGRDVRLGYTEEIIGEWLAQGGRRDQIVLATKVYGAMGDGVNERGLSAYHIRKACEDSLRRLQTDHIDLYQMHHVERSTPWDEIWQAMEQLVREGKILYVGSSNFAAWHIVQANEAAARRNFLGLVSEQSRYNLTVRTIELELLPACRAYSPLGGGLLGGVLEQPQSGRRASEQMQARVAKHRAQIEQYEALCAELGEAPANVALAWALHQPGITAPIIGPRMLQQFEKSLRSVEIKLAPDVLDRLDKIWPGPGGEAPEAYAW